MNEALKYFNLWRKSALKLMECLNNGDKESAEMYQEQVNEAFEKYKEASEYADNMLNAKFSTLENTFESVIPKLFVKNSKLIKEGMGIIKEDKNLLSQFKFFNALKNFNCDSDATDYVNESLNLVAKNIDLKSMKKSNRKFAEFIVENNIKSNELMSDDDVKFYESCDYLLTHKKTLNNLGEYKNHVKVVSDYITEHKKENQENPDVLSLAETVEKKMNSLNEAEKAFVGEIMSAKGNNAKKEKLFNNIKKECIASIDKLISENEGAEKERLLNMKETIMMKEYDANTIVADVAKLLEIGSILSDNDHDKFL